MLTIKTNRLKDVSSYVIFFLGLLLIIIGVPTILLPPPFAFGLVFVAIGFMLTTASLPGRKLWRYLREHWCWFGKKTANLHKIVRSKLESRTRQKIRNAFDPYSKMLITLDIALNKTRPK